MKQKIIWNLIPAILLMSAFFCGCGDDSSDEKKEKIQVSQIFPKIEDHGMELNIISTLASYRIKDPNPTMKFQFINEGLAAIRIPESVAGPRNPGLTA